MMLQATESLVNEKMVEGRGCAKLVIVIDESKLSASLGSNGPLPVHVAQEGWQHTCKRLEQAVGEHVSLLGDQVVGKLRAGEGGSPPYVTANGNYIVDIHLGEGAAITDKQALGLVLSAEAGVVEHGMFVDKAAVVIVARPGGIEIRQRQRPEAGTSSSSSSL
jgi:ribose 5-phosphate isomerase A